MSGPGGVGRGRQIHGVVGDNGLTNFLEKAVTRLARRAIYNRGAMRTWAFLIFASALGAQTPAVQPLLDQAIKDSGAASVSVAVASGGKIVFAGTAGQASIAAGRAAGLDTRYAVGSISKQFTAAAILLLAEQRKLSLDDKVSKYFPDLTRANEITIRELLSHTSGYEDYAPQDYTIPEWLKATTSRAILEKWAKKPLDFDPGTKWQYSNTNFVLAAEIFEKVSGEALVAFLKKNIFDPLGMTSAGSCESLGPNDATAYTRYVLGPPREVSREAPGWYNGAGELCMTASDLAKWDIAFLQKKILSAQSYAEFTTEVKLKNGDLTNYALGLQVGSYRNMPSISHGGEVSGFLAQNTVYPTRQGAVVVLSNEDAISMVGPLAQKIAALVFLPPDQQVAESELNTQTVRSILEGLMQGRIDRALLTSNLSGYFTAAVLEDYKNSLSSLGALQSLTRTNSLLRGGMTYRSYRVQFAQKTLVISTYVTSDGLFEQYLVMDQI